MFEEMKKKLEMTLKVVGDDLLMIKTGRAKPSLVEGVMIEAYEGTARMPLNELASITAPDPTQILVSPWDQSILKKIVAGLAASELNLNPIVDGNMIRMVIPALTEERRKDLVKLVRQKIEGGKEMMREVRNETKKMVDGKKDEPDVSEDDIKRWLEEMQTIFEEYSQKLVGLGEEKETELMSI